MREILFRGKRTDNGEWVEGDYIHLPNGIAILANGYGYIDPETVGQYTGLTDKNGKKIYEGDIVKDEQSYLFGTVVYATAQDGFDGMAEFMVDDIDNGLQDYNGFWHLVEVIGNIYDNPELIGR